MRRAGLRGLVIHEFSVLAAFMVLIADSDHGPVSEPHAARGPVLVMRDAPLPTAIVCLTRTDPDRHPLDAIRLRQPFRPMTQAGADPAMTAVLKIDPALRVIAPGPGRVVTAHRR